MTRGLLSGGESRKRREEWKEGKVKGYGHPSNKYDASLGLLSLIIYDNICSVQITTIRCNLEMKFATSSFKNVLWTILIEFSANFNNSEWTGPGWR